MTRTVDTRFFLTHFFGETEDLRKKTEAKMFQLRRESAVVPTVVIHEVFKFVCQRIGKDSAKMVVDSILKGTFNVTPLDQDIAVTSGELRCEVPQVPTADAIIAATASAKKALPVVTDDPHFRKLAGIRTEWL